MLGTPPYLRQVQASNPRRLSQATTHDDDDDDDDDDNDNDDSDGDNDDLNEAI